MDETLATLQNTQAVLVADASVCGCRLVALDTKDGSHILTKGSALVGKSSACELQLSDPSVSGRHLRIQLIAGGMRVEDLGSTNGTHYLGTRLEQAVVPHGAVLKVGRTRLALLSLEPEANDGVSALTRYGDILGASPAMRRLYTLLERLAPTEYTTLIQGETGAGKEVVAREIHRHSPRKDRRLEVFDCSAVPQNLAESELFGHVRGAFTGAHTAREGVFTRADGGTLFLDEIGEMPLELQPKLLRALESRTIRPLGGDRTHSVDVRVVVATNRDLADEVRLGRFREDLFFRLAVVTVRIPPLRDRREDIPALVHHFMAETGCEISSDTLELFTCGYDWPGNVRELKNAIAQTLSFGGIPEAMRVTTESSGGTNERADPDQPFLESKKRLVDSFERDYLSCQLQRADNNIARAARASGVDRSYFKRLLRRHDLMPK